MSQYPASFDQPQQQGSGMGLAITALVLAILGMCIPLLGLVAVILGIVVLARGGKAGAGFGLALAAVIVGALSLFSTLLLIGILLPALGKARESARQLKSSTQLRQIDLALLSYASDNKGWMPEAGTDWQARLQPYGVTQPLLVSPRADGPNATDSYVYIPGFCIDTIKNPYGVVIAYENSKYLRQSDHANVAFADGHVEAVSVKDLQTTLDKSPKPDAIGGATAPPRPKPKR